MKSNHPQIVAKLGLSATSVYRLYTVENLFGMVRLGGIQILLR
jgi:hypothetical protein